SILFRALTSRVAHARSAPGRTPPYPPLRKGGRGKARSVDSSPLTKGGYRGVLTHQPWGVRHASATRSSLEPQRPCADFAINPGVAWPPVSAQAATARRRREGGRRFSSPRRDRGLFRGVSRRTRTPRSTSCTTAVRSAPSSWAG